MLDQEYKVKDSRCVPSPALIWYGQTKRFDPTKAMSCTNSRTMCQEDKGDMAYPTSIHQNCQDTRRKWGGGSTGEKRLVTAEESEGSVRDCTLILNTNLDD